MNEAQFDRLARLIGRATTRRQILGGAAGLGGATLLAAGARRAVSAQHEPRHRWRRQSPMASYGSARTRRR